MREESFISDVTVIGGGMAGVCAAIAAARLGVHVALVQNRPVLGGNASSEVRVWVCGATAHGVHQYARETGIMGELFLENQYRNPDGNPVYWDLVVLEAVRSEPNITLFLNTDVRVVEASGPETERHISSVSGWMMGSERSIKFHSPIFLDCTGDGLVGFLAGAKYRIGRESAAEYGESLAPVVSDDAVMGSTIVFYTKDAGHPVKFVPPHFAKDITTTSIPENRIIRAGDNGAAYWWIEWGGEVDTVHDNEQIRDELWSVIYGIWDYLKNSRKFDTENMTLEWVGAVPGKREYRRFAGDYTLIQGDILEQTPFEDRVAFGGWSIDLHSPEGMYGDKASEHWYSDGIYHLPLRSLYSSNVSNLLFAGRNISASHVAFGGTRVMATCAVLGEAAGSAAALCAQTNTTPRQVATERIAQLQRAMLRQDAAIIGLPYRDEADLAQRASVAASGTVRKLIVDDSSSRWNLAADAGLILPVNPTQSDIEVLLDVEGTTTVTAALYDTSRAENYLPNALIAQDTVPVAVGKGQWIRFDLGWEPLRPRNAFLVLKANPEIALHLAGPPPFGLLAFTRKSKTAPSNPEDRIRRSSEWTTKPLHGRTFCIRSRVETDAFSPKNIIDGYLRPYGGPHLWMSEPLHDDNPAWIELSWPTAISIGEVCLTFNDDVNEHLINLHAYHTPFEIAPNLVRDYHIDALQDEEWVTVLNVSNNRRRRRRHIFPERVKTKQVRVFITATNGSRHAEIVGISCYSSPLTAASE